MSTTTRVSREQRFTKHNPCPVCGGGDDDKRHQGIRCKMGFLSDDGRYAHCGNTDYAGGLQPDRNSMTYPHRLDGPCRCGEDHSAGVNERRPANIRDFTPRPITRTHQRHTPIANHVYRNRDRSARFRVARLWSKRTGPPPDAPNLPKCIPQREDGGWPGEWIDGLDGAPYAGLYLLPELAEADPFAPVWIPEGEGKVDALVSQGEVATCHAGGAGKWSATPPGDLEALRGRQLVLLTDNDDKGRMDTEQGAALLLSIAASVRVLALPDLPPGGDVADWLTAGHTIAELRRLAAATPIISAQLPPDQDSNPAMQDESTVQSPKTCTGCARLTDQLRIAETSLANLRREHAIESRYLRMSTSKLSAPVKLAAIVVRRELKAPTQTRPHDGQGLEQVYRGAIASRLGVSDQAAGTYLRKLGDAGLITRRVVRNFDNTEIFIGEGPLADVPEQVQEPQRVSGWGGKRVRVKACPHCRQPGQLDVICHNCGCHSKPEELIDVEVFVEDETPEGEAPSEEAQPQAQEHTPPEEMIVVDLASHAQERQPDTYQRPSADTWEAHNAEHDPCTDGHSHHYAVGVCLKCDKRKAG